ncbi:diguanylate cyclase [Priestia megaterium]|uniref:diguanylate cyclase n=1 Tax=Priestia megaterium TaxID=1404 RepID=UPI000BF9C6A1|nr:diguanylate cyclase [Priestia megaterium]MCM3151431.1 diguanylate cyclase [Priestia megaterium]PEU71389.1 diguanylate cyclase [Priestia megaterium]PFQ85885.1 diguanylate cyclase [Priestia megaterium]PFW51537.1 diguanylate cyclase [Priestia megaterium]PGR03832.1 diguanylate cyclase [Priestia megaterium]
MLFKATAQKTIMFALLLLYASLFIQAIQYKVLAFLLLFAILCSFLSLFLRYEFQIDKDALTYRTYILWFKVYAKTVKPMDIKRIVFKRLSWKAKLAVVQVENGWNMRIALFNPPNVFRELERFAHEYDVDIQKTSDYKILDKTP